MKIKKNFTLYIEKLERVKIGYLAILTKLYCKYR